jgi:hypothetical protein
MLMKLSTHSIVFIEWPKRADECQPGIWHAEVTARLERIIVIDDLRAVKKKDADMEGKLAA